MKRLVDFLKQISIECYMVCLYFVCLPFTVVTTPFGSLLKLVTMPVIAVLAIKLFVGKQKPLRFNSVHLVYSVYMLYSFLGLFILRNELAVTQTTDMLLTFAAILLITMREYKKSECEMIETTWILVGIICTYLSLTSTEVANQFESRTMVYVFGFAEDPNQFCAYFIMPVMICIKRIIERRRTLPFYLALIILIMYSVLRSGSRGGMIGILIGVILCLFIAVKSLKAKMGMTLVVIICALMVVTVIFPLLPEDVQMRYSIQSVAEDRGAGRFLIWEYLVNYTLENPQRLIFGSGMLSTYGVLEGASVVDAAGAAHNQFVQVFCDQGIIGLGLFLILIAVCFLRNIKSQPYYSCAFVSVIAFSMSLTMYVFKPYINIIIMCALSFAAQNDLKGDSNEFDNRLCSKAS